MKKIYSIESGHLTKIVDWPILVKMNESAEIISCSFTYENHSIIIDFIDRDWRSSNFRKFSIKNFYSLIQDHEIFRAKLGKNLFLFESFLISEIDKKNITSQIMHEDSDGELCWTTQYDPLNEISKTLEQK